MIIVTAKKGDLKNDNRFDYNNENVEIYTISNEGELQEVGKIPLLLLKSRHLSSGAQYSVNYAFVNGNGYISTGTQIGDTYRQYYRYSPSGLQLEVTFETLLITDVGTSFSIDEKSVEQSVFEEHYYSFEQQAVTHSVSGVLESEVELIKKINNETMIFLQNYN